MRIFISTDIEGVAGIAHLPSTGPWRFEWNQARHWMTNEALAAIEGAREAGATSFVVSDGHGSAHNLLVDRFADDTEIVRGWPRPLLQMDGIQRGSYDACVFVGHHTMAQADAGILSHSFTLTFREIRINGTPQSETTINAMVAQHYGVPTVFSSGDSDYLTHLRKFLPDIEFVETQRPLTYTSVDSLTPGAACEAIRKGVRRAIDRRSDISRIALPEKFELEFDFYLRSQPEMLEYLLIFERIAPLTVRTIVDNADQALRIIAFLAFYQAEGVPRYGERKL